MFTIKHCYCCKLSTCIKIGCAFCIISALIGAVFLSIELLTHEYVIHDILSRLLSLIFCVILTGFYVCLFLVIQKEDQDSILALVKGFASPLIFIFSIQFFDSIFYLTGGKLDHGIRLLIIAAIVFVIMAIFWYIMYSYYVQLKAVNAPADV